MHQAWKAPNMEPGHQSCSRPPGGISGPYPYTTWSLDE